MTLEDLVERARAALAAVESDAVRERHEQALAHLASYVDLLHEATQFASAQHRTPNSSDRNYWLKLELADGSWTVAYQPLPASPEVGDIIETEPGSHWQIRRVQTVKPAPPRAPERDYLVCAPAA